MRRRMGSRRGAKGESGATATPLSPKAYWSFSCARAWCRADPCRRRRAWRATRRCDAFAPDERVPGAYGAEPLAPVFDVQGSRRLVAHRSKLSESALDMLEFDIGHSRGQETARGLGFLLFIVLVTISATRQRTLDMLVRRRAGTPFARTLLLFQAAPLVYATFCKNVRNAGVGAPSDIAHWFAERDEEFIVLWCGVRGRLTAKEMARRNAASFRRRRAPCRCA